MKTSFGAILCLLIISTSIILISCKEDVTKSNDNNINLSLHKSYDCATDPVIIAAKDSAIVLWSYSDSILKMNLLINYNCATSFVDNVEIDRNQIIIYLNDTKPGQAYCYCEFKEEYEFEITECDVVFLKLYVKDYESDSYNQLLEKKLDL